MASARRNSVGQGDIAGLLDGNVDTSDDGEDFLSENEHLYDEMSDNSNSSGEENEMDSEVEDRPNVEVSDGWTAYLPNDPDFPKLDFNLDSGYKPPIRNAPITELDFFQLFFTDSLLNQIVAETNRYAKEQIQIVTPLKKRSIWITWREISLPELKAFLGVLLAMGMNSKCRIQDYFSEDWVDRQPFFKEVFSRERFLQIFWMLHLPPSQNVAPRTRGSKVNSDVHYLDETFQEYYIPGRNISIDESTVAFKGRIIFKCYNAQKPTKWGLRVYVLADSSNGYVSAIEPYYGATTTAALVRPDLSFTCRIVLHLCDKLLQANNGATGYHLYTDRFYTGYDLAIELLNLSIHTTGTVMTNRKGLPTSVKKKNIRQLKKHEKIAFRKDNKILLLVWKDKRNVAMLSTWHNVEMKTVNRITKTGPEEVQKPTVICEYNENMGGVDTSDHYISSYGFARKCLKWWRKMFFWLLEVSILNSFILFNLQRCANQEKPVFQRVYRKALIVQLVGEVRNRASRKRGRPSTADAEERLNGKTHFIYSNAKSNTKDCAVCSDRKRKGGRKETVFFCNTCIRKPGLHPGACFEKYHTEKVYR